MIIRVLVAILILYLLGVLFSFFVFKLLPGIMLLGLIGVTYLVFKKK